MAKRGSLKWQRLIEDRMDENCLSDDQIRRNRRELQRRLPRDVRTDAANNHVKSLMTMPLEEVKQALLARDTYSTMYSSFLDGWDAAMSIRSEELLEEHKELHAKIMEIEIQKIRDEGQVQ